MNTKVQHIIKIKMPQQPAKVVLYIVTHVL